MTLSLGYRTAFEGMADKDGVVFLSSSYNRTYGYPGLTVALVKGAGRQAGDQPISGRPLFFPSTARLLLENLTIDRHPLKRCVPQSDIEKRLAAMNEARGEGQLIALREEARALAQPLGLEREFFKLNKIIGAILGTRPGHDLKDPSARAAARGLPYDSARIALFDSLVAKLRTMEFTPVPECASTSESRINMGFLESYFSNFIEGTEFEIEEARDIALHGKLAEKRPADSHDILGVFRQIVHPGWRSQTLSTKPQVLDQLKERHADIMQARPETEPGEFKDKMNYAGNTAFVAPGLVRGTLVEGARRLADVGPGMPRAILAMFLVAEVHPFADGNGRLARLAMNAELSAAGECRIIIPTLAREEYLDCLRQFSRQGYPEGLIRFLVEMHRWSAAFVYEDLDAVIIAMKSCNALERSLAQFKLLTPSQREEILP
ncbi:MAG: Fic family protein [Thiobacillaceae bacterium]